MEERKIKKKVITFPEFLQYRKEKKEQEKKDLFNETLGVMKKALEEMDW